MSVFGGSSLHRFSMHVKPHEMLPSDNVSTHKFNQSVALHARCSGQVFWPTFTKPRMVLLNRCEARNMSNESDRAWKTDTVGLDD